MLKPTVVATPWWARALIWIVLPLAGAGLLLLAVQARGWIPLPAPLGLLRTMRDVWAMTGAGTLGALLGLTLAWFADRESLTVRLTTTEVALIRPGTTVTVARGEVSVAFRDGDQLVLLGRTGRELAREPSHVAAHRLAAAFAGHGIGWAEQDPYLDAYRRWVPGLPDLPDAVFAARQSALEKGDESDVRELRAELDRLGYAVRDRKKKQYYRPVG